MSSERRRVICSACHSDADDARDYIVAEEKRARPSAVDARCCRCGVCVRAPTRRVADKPKCCRRLNFD
uniref:Uncharacterized protein n=1 Tax=Lymantria dispar multicapsid nuclear polyhedrosis virus TaxID=10449 RepID=A0A6H0F296_NPVLD|nr:hypothetical protein [Lymantria dispar multiple nucleopolyhedrovirus]